MNFIDRYRKDMEEQEQNREEPTLIHEGFLKDGGGSFTATVDKEQLDSFIKAILNDNGTIGSGNLTRDYAEEIVALPLVFHEKLKGKFSKRQIADMTCNAFELLACLASVDSPV